MMPQLTEVPLAHGALLIAQDAYPGLPLRKYLGRLDSMGYELQSRTARGSARRSARARLEILVDYLFSEQGFQGNSIHYYDPRNNFLNEVLDRRLGLPITLSIVTLEMCSRVGLKAMGIGFPSHFVVGVETEERGIQILDPFHEGALLGPEEVRGRLGESIPNLAPMDKRTILTRLLNNLKVIYWSEGRFDKALPVLERLVALNPDHVTEFRDRGLAHHHLGRHAHALMDLERFLVEMGKGPPSASQVQPGEVEAIHELVRWLRLRVRVSPMLH